MIFETTPLYSSSIEMWNPMDEEYSKLNTDNLEVLGQKRIQFLHRKIYLSSVVIPAEVGIQEKQIPA